MTSVKFLRRMTSPSPNRTDASTLRGELRVEVPHWAAQLRVFDSMGRLTLQPDQMTVQAGPTQGGHSGWLATAELIPGVYEVELSLAGQTARQLVIVRATESSRLSVQSWHSTSFAWASSIPLADAASPLASQRRAAEIWSREPTWTRSSGNSRLFLFVRTLTPEKDRHFFDNLSLLDRNERLITDFSKDVRVNKQEGWMAFTANLPAGLYLLKRQRYDQFRTKYQPLYLCEQWETHAFLMATRRPSLQTLALSMARLGTGFRAGDETVRAAEILLDSLKRSASPDRLVTVDAVLRLLSNRVANPWLLMVAAYIIRLQQDLLTSADESPSEVWSGLLAAWPTLLESLATLSDHPDVRALQLTMDAPANKPIDYPPMLYAGLRRVQQHALRFTDTIPVNSPLKRVLPRVSTTSAWTAWRQTSQPAQAPVRHKDAAGEADVMADAPESMPPAPVINSAAPDYLRLVSPKLPVYQVRATAPSAQDTSGSAGGAGQLVSNALLNVLAIQVTQQLSAAPLEQIPMTTQLTPAADLANLLNNDHAGAISQASGVPLAQVQSSLTKLQATCQQPDKPGKQLTTYDRTVFGYAVQRAIEGMLGDPLLTTIEECISKLLTESGRLSAPFMGGKQPPAVESLVGRINTLADQLLLSARFVVVTDADGKIALSNGVFVILLKEQAPAAKLSDWESFFRTAPFGHSILPHALVNKGSAAWSLQRTVLHDDEHNRVLYLNLFQNQDGLLLTPEHLKRLETLLPKLVLATSSIAYDQSAEAGQLSDNQHQQLQKLETVLGQMEGALTSVP